jgi:nucleotide-binding universal stress UspA family protein
MFKSIVVAYDGSAHARKALEAASTLAAAVKSRVGIIFVIEAGRAHLPENIREMGEVEHIIEPMPKSVVNLENAPANMVNNLASSSAASQRAMMQYADYLLEQARKSANAVGVSDIEVKAALGDAAEEVAEFASERDADLIVCGSRGHGGLKKLLLGSTSHKIAQLAECSCLTVK